MTGAAQRLAYLAWASLARCAKWRPACPECGSPNSARVDRKYVVTELRRCRSCRLMYRIPHDSPTFNRWFYNLFYSQGFTTDVPDQTALDAMLVSGFKDTPKDFDRYIEVLRMLGARPGQRLFDFGASWGYGSWQLRRAGFEVVASEISRSRRHFASEKLGVSTVEDPFDPQFREEFAGRFDIFFSSHVLEHVPQPGRVWTLARELLRSGGLFVAITPNGAEEARRTNPEWRKLWGLVHPNLIDDEFYLARFSAPARLVASLPLDPHALSDWAAGGDTRLSLSGGELLFAARL